MALESRSMIHFTDDEIQMLIKDLSGQTAASAGLIYFEGIGEDGRFTITLNYRVLADNLYSGKLFTIGHVPALNKVFFGPIEDMPLYVNDEVFKKVALWRLKIGR